MLVYFHPFFQINWSQIHVREPVKPHQKPVEKCSDLWHHLSNLSKWQVTITTLSQQLKQWTDDNLSMQESKNFVKIKNIRTIKGLKLHGHPSWSQSTTQWSERLIVPWFEPKHIFALQMEDNSLYFRTVGVACRWGQNFPDETDQKQSVQSGFWRILTSPSKWGIRHPILLGCWLLVENYAWTSRHFTQPEE